MHLCFCSLCSQTLWYVSSGLQCSQFYHMIVTWMADCYNSSMEKLNSHFSSSWVSNSKTERSWNMNFCSGKDYWLYNLDALQCIFIPLIILPNNKCAIRDEEQKVEKLAAPQVCRETPSGILMHVSEVAHSELACKSDRWDAAVPSTNGTLVCALGAV